MRFVKLRKVLNMLWMRCIEMFKNCLCFLEFFILLCCKKLKCSVCILISISLSTSLLRTIAMFFCLVYCMCIEIFFWRKNIVKFIL